MTSFYRIFPLYKKRPAMRDALVCTAQMGKICCVWDCGRETTASWYIKLGKGIINVVLSLYTSGSIAASQFLDFVNAYHVEVALNRML